MSSFLLPSTIQTTDGREEINRPFPRKRGANSRLTEYPANVTLKSEMKRFEIIDVSGDAGIMAYGKSIEGLFENAAVGMYTLMTNPDSIQEKRSIDVAVEKDSLEGLLVAWLNELIFRFEVDGFVGKRIVVTASTSTQGNTSCGSNADEPFAMRASLSGEDFDPSRHEGKLLLKAATYHNLRIEKKSNIWSSRIIFDV